MGRPIVEQSKWIRDLERRNRVHPRHDAARYVRLTHFILPLKECTVEVVAEKVSVLRHLALPQALPQPCSSDDQVSLRFRTLRDKVVRCEAGGKLQLTNASSGSRVAVGETDTIQSGFKDGQCQYGFAGRRYGPDTMSTTDYRPF
jgi:hypothetical protein